MAEFPNTTFGFGGGRLSTKVEGARAAVTGDTPLPSMAAGLAMRARRSALIVTTSVYDDHTLQALARPAGRVSSLVDPLFDPDIGNYDEPPPVADQTARVAMDEIERFFADRRSSDYLLLYVSCVAIHQGGELYFATTDTSLASPQSASVPAAFLLDQIRRCGTDRVVVILDCPYTASFDDGGLRPGAWLDLDSLLPGTGRAMISAPEVLRDGPSANAPDLAAILNRGLRDGEADGDGNGYVDGAELFAYLAKGVGAVAPNETARVLDRGLGSRLIVARSGRREGPSIKEIKLKPPRRPTEPSPAPEAPPQRAPDRIPIDGNGTGTRESPTSGESIFDRIRESARHMQEEGTSAAPLSVPETVDHVASVPGWRGNGSFGATEPVRDYVRLPAAEPRPYLPQAPVRRPRTGLIARLLAHPVQAALVGGGLVVATAAGALVIPFDDETPTRRDQGTVAGASATITQQELDDITGDAQVPVERPLALKDPSAFDARERNVLQHLANRLDFSPDELDMVVVRMDRIDSAATTVENAGRLPKDLSVQVLIRNGLGEAMPYRLRLTIWTFEPPLTSCEDAKRAGRILAENGENQSFFFEPLAPGNVYYDILRYSGTELNVKDQATDIESPSVDYCYDFTFSY